MTIDPWLLRALIVLAALGAIQGLDGARGRIRRHLGQRAHARAHAKAMLKWSNRRKGKILGVVPRPDPEKVPDPPPWFTPGVQFAFLIPEAVIYVELHGVPIIWTGPDGVPVWGGYTVDELQEIAKSPSEFIHTPGE